MKINLSDVFSNVLKFLMFRINLHMPSCESDYGEESQSYSPCFLGVFYIFFTFWYLLWNYVKYIFTVDVLKHILQFWVIHGLNNFFNNRKEICRHSFVYLIFLFICCLSSILFISTVFQSSTDKLHKNIPQITQITKVSIKKYKTSFISKKISHESRYFDNWRSKL